MRFICSFTAIEIALVITSHAAHTAEKLRVAYPAVAPGSTQSDATVIALQMWRTSFGGVNDFGVGSAIAVFLFVLVIPVLALNVRRFRREV